MRSKSKKRAAIDRVSERVVLDFRLRYGRCMVCQVWQGRAIQVHEIASGPARAKARGERCCLLALCLECHEAIHKSRNLARELAIKLTRDPDHYDRSRVLELMGFADTYVTQQEVIGELKNVGVITEDRRES
jgi:hypothetical protein